MSHIQKTVTLSNGKTIHIETGRLARQADGAVVVRCGDTMLLATVVADKKSDVTLDFLPLSVDYVEKFSSTGRIPGGFFKREGKLGEGEILISRLVDRALRPLFPDDYHSSVQVIVQLISSDKSEQADALACFAASSAIIVSDIPFADPVSEVRVARKNGVYMINPTVSEMEGCELDLIVAGTNDSIVMVEGEMQQVSEEEFLDAMIEAHKAIKVLNDLQLELRAEVAKTTREYDVDDDHSAIRARMMELIGADVEAVTRANAPKQERSTRFEEIYTTAKETIAAEFLKKEGEEEGYDQATIDRVVKMFFKDIQKEIVRRITLEEGVRLDGRKLDEIRPIWSEVGYLPRSHGSAIFTRGETQSLATVTLGTKLDEQTIDTATWQGKKNFMLHYNFPPFSTGEAKFLRGPGRREIGHGNLAERALKPMIPTGYDYTIRLVSDILESNGSSSMATVCSGTLALMDAGVPIKAPVSGIAMGLMTDKKTGKVAVLSDILGDEDFLGDMDFKVTGTKSGLTACQMDMKVRGLSYEVLRQALEQSKRGRMHILEKILETIDTPRTDLSPYAPRIETVDIPTDMIGAVIGPGGKIIQEIQRVSATTINIEEVEGKGVATVYSVDRAGLDKAVSMIKDIIAIPEVGQEYDAKVKSIKEFGAFVEFMPGKEGLLHISEISYDRLESMEGVLNVGDKLRIKLIGVDPKSGKFRLSHKVLLPKPEGYVERSEGNGDRGDRGGRGGDRGGDRGDRRNNDRRGDRRDNRR